MALSPFAVPDHRHRHNHVETHTGARDVTSVTNNEK